jgi:hypothetical protein
VDSDTRRHRRSSQASLSTARPVLGLSSPAPKVRLVHVEMDGGRPHVLCARADGHKRLRDIALTPLALPPSFTPYPRYRTVPLPLSLTCKEHVNSERSNSRKCMIVIQPAL